MAQNSEEVGSVEEHPQGYAIAGMFIGGTGALFVFSHYRSRKPRNSYFTC